MLLRFQWKVVPWLVRFRKLHRAMLRNAFFSSARCAALWTASALAKSACRRAGRSTQSCDGHAACSDSEAGACRERVTWWWGRLRTYGIAVGLLSESGRDLSLLQRMKTGGQQALH